VQNDPLIKVQLFRCVTLCRLVNSYKRLIPPTRPYLPVKRASCRWWLAQQTANKARLFGFVWWLQNVTAITSSL